VKYLYQYAGLYLAFLIQSLFLENLKLFSCSPDIVITVIIIFSVHMSLTQSAVFGGVAGLLTDAVFGTVFGANLIKYMYLGIAVSIFADKRHSNSPLIMSWISFVSVAATEIAVAVLKAFVGMTPTATSVFSRIFVRGIFAALFTLVFVLLSLYFKKRAHKENRDSSGEEAQI